MNQTDIEYSPTSPLSPSEALNTRPLEEEILAVKSGPAFNVMVSMLLITLVICYFAYDSAPRPSLVIWVSAMLLMAAFRVTIQQRLDVDSTIDLKTRMNIALGLSAITGLVHASSLVFFPGFTLTERAIQTVILLGLVNGAISTNSGYKPFFLAYSAPVTVGITLAWGGADIAGESLVIAYSVVVLNLFYYVIMYSNAKNHFRFFKDSFETREKQMQLNAELEHKNTALDFALNEAITARKEADLANTSKTRFLASASHDLRQPTQVISLLTGVLTRQELDKKSMSIALDIHQASQNLQALMTSLLDISKLDAGLMAPRIETIDLAWLISRVCNEFEAQAYDKGLRLIFISDFGSASTRSDPQLTERILRNLVSNAVKYTDHGQIEISLLKQKSDWTVSISDTGCGIDPREQERIFEEFYQVGNAHRDSANGLGLGLAIVKRLNDTLNLSLKCESQLNVGSTFSFNLPVIDEDSEHKIITIKKRSLEGLHILCIDDEKDILRAMSLVFELLKCSSDLVEGINEAIIAATHKKPDIVLADFSLIGELNGVDAIHAIRTIHPNMPALLVTGDTSPERLQLANRVGINMLHKPLAMDTLAQAIGEEIDKTNYD